MLMLQFAFTKNLNHYVTAYYIPSASWIENGKFTQQLLLMTNLDLADLYARKFRKKIYEKKISSNLDFYNEIHVEINKNYLDKQSIIYSKVRSQENPELYLQLEIDSINTEIDRLYEFCKSCKPKKKKKR